MISAHGLDHRHGRVQVLFDVGFEVRAGEVLALLGANGSGKSTLVRLLSGLEAPDRGEVRIKGRPVTSAPAGRRVRMGIVTVVGGRATFGPLSVEENLRVAAYAYRRADAGARVARALGTFAALEERRDCPARDLSGGQQQQLALAMALVHQPQVLIVDELSLGLAPLVVRQVVSLLRGWRAEGMTMIVVEQSLHVALALADRAVFLEKGRVRFEGAAAELAARPELARAVLLGT